MAVWNVFSPTLLSTTYYAWAHTVLPFPPGGVHMGWNNKMNVSKTLYFILGDLL
jgi:hypothetical protein